MKRLKHYGSKLKYKGCFDCGSRQYHARNRCRKCYFKFVYRHDPKRRAMIKRNTLRWIKGHPKRWRQIVNKASRKFQAKLRKLKKYGQI